MQSLTPVRFIYVPSECVHRIAWNEACGECEALAAELSFSGPSVIPKNVMALATVVTTNETRRELPAGRLTLTENTTRLLSD